MSATFLGSSIIDFSYSLGRNGQSGGLTLHLVDDPIQGDMFLPPLPGTPLYFTFEGQSYNGIFERYIKKSGPDGFTYEVSISDPASIINNTQVILDGYTGTPTVKNLLNVYGYWENLGFGLSDRNENGMPWNLVLTAIQDMLNGNSEYGSPLEFLGYRYRLDLSQLPIPSQYYRINGSVVGLTDILNQICDDFSCDFHYRLYQVDGYHTIILYTIAKNRNAPTGLITRFLNSTPGAISITSGMELRNQPTCKMLLGAQINSLNLRYADLSLNNINSQIQSFGSDGRSSFICPIAQNRFYKNSDTELSLPVISERFRIARGITTATISEISDATIFPYFGTYDSGWQYLPVYAYEETDFLSFLNSSAQVCDRNSWTNKNGYIQSGGERYAPFHGFIRKPREFSGFVLDTPGKSVLYAMAWYHDSVVLQSLTPQYPEFITFGELKSTFEGQDSWEDFLNHHASFLRIVARVNLTKDSITVRDTFLSFQEMRKLTNLAQFSTSNTSGFEYGVQKYRNVTDRVIGPYDKAGAYKTNGVLQNNPANPNKMAPSDERYDPDRIRNAKIFESLSSLAADCYGKKFLVKLDLVDAKLDSNLLPVFTHQPSSEGYYEGSILNINEFEKLFFRNDNNKLQCFVEFDSVNFIDLTKLNTDDYIITIPASDLQELIDQDGGQISYGNTTITNVLEWWTDVRLPTSARLYLKCGINERLLFKSLSIQLQALGAPSNSFSYDDIRAIVELPYPVFFRPGVYLDARSYTEDGNITSVPNFNRNFPYRLVSETSVLAKRSGLAKGSPTTVNEQQDITSQTGGIGSKVANMSETPDVLVPRAVVVGLIHNNERYGPWTAIGAAGQVEFEQDDSLNPWTFNSVANMNLAANAKIAAAASEMLYGETGTIEVPGYPTLLAGDPLLAGGPLVTDVSVQIGTQGITTTYTMAAFNTSTRLPYMEYDRLRVNAQQKPKVPEIIKKRIFENKAITQGDKRKLDVKLGTPHEMIVGQHRVSSSGTPLGSGTNRNVVSETIIEMRPELNNDYTNVGGISMDGLFTPFSTNNHSVLPHFNDAGRQSALFPYPSGHDIQVLINGSTPDNLYNPMDSGRNYRGIGLKLPMVGVGWGYDSQDLPVPGNGSGNFADNYLNPSGWKAGPIDLRWDESKGVWSAAGGSNVYRGLAQETIAPFGTGSGIIYGTASGTTSVLFNSWLGQPVCSGQRLIVFKEESTYYIQQAEFSALGVVTSLVCNSGSNELLTSRRNIYVPGAFSGAEINVIGN